ncbi:MAG: flagellar protein FlaG [Miltoncostaeaceae bacterium]
MDVTGPRPVEAPPPATRLPPASAAADEARRVPARDAGPAPAGDEDPPPIPIAESPWVPRSTLKMGLTAADVDARFEIDRDGSRITVTMYDRISGEVLRQIPPKEVQDVIDALAGRGLMVDLQS